jgi:membrane-bound lytic murein transglycosylase D
MRKRDLGSAALTFTAVVGAAAMVLNGPMVDRPAAKPVAEIVSRVVTGPSATEAIPEMPPSGVDWDLPNLRHSSIDAWVGRMSGPMKGSLAIYMKRMAKYESMIAAKAEQKGVPADLVYLAMIESGGNPRALSPVKARGLWQFMSATARDYGLKVTGKRDDRIDPVRATDAALDYLSDLHRTFGSWYLAAAAYNTGQGRVARILKQATGRTRGTDADFFHIASLLPKETRDYVPKLIAVARIAKEPAKYGITPAYLASVPLVEPGQKRVVAKKVVPTRRVVAKKVTPAKRVVSKKAVPTKRVTTSRPAVSRSVAASRAAAARRATAKARATAAAAAAKRAAARRAAAG